MRFTSGAYLYLLRLVAANRWKLNLISLLGYGVFFWCNLRVDGGITSKKGGYKMHHLSDTIAFIGYFALAMYYLMHLLKH